MSRLFVPLTAETGPDFKSHPEHGRLEKKGTGNQLLSTYPMSQNL